MKFPSYRSHDELTSIGAFGRRSYVHLKEGILTKPKRGNQAYCVVFKHCVFCGNHSVDSHKNN